MQGNRRWWWPAHALILAGLVAAEGGEVPYCGIVGGPSGALALARDGGEETVATLGIARLLYVRVRFPSDEADPASLAEVQADVSGANGILRRASFDAFGLDPTFTPVLSLSKDRGEYGGPGGFDEFIEDARQAAAAAGYPYQEFDLEVVRHSGVPGFAGGNARLGRRGAQVQVGGPIILTHEIGHNLGLSHANFWDTTGPAVSAGSPPLPSHFRTLPEPRSVPVYPDSAVGHDTVTGAGASLEYGDPWDIMGSGDADFSATYKAYLGWLAEDAFTTADAGQTKVRLWSSHDEDANEAGLIRGIRVPDVGGPNGAERTLTIEMPSTRQGASAVEGVLLRWTDDSPGHGSSLLLDGTPGTPRVNSDAELPLGRTFEDRLSDVFITVVDSGDVGGVAWADVVISRGLNRVSTNADPVLWMDTSELSLAPEEAFDFAVIALDADGDDLAISWDFGDGTPLATGSGVRKSWKQAGEYLARVEASDLRGGWTSSHRRIRVGEPQTARVEGHVRDGEGRPVPHVRVHNGRIRGVGGGADRVTTWTDSEGAFVLCGLEAGQYFCGAFHPDYDVDPVSPVELSAGDVRRLDFVARALPRISVASVGSLSESGGLARAFTVTRSGSTEKPLTVLFRLGGTASVADYARPLVDRLVIPAGSATASLDLVVHNDTIDEPDESIRYSVGAPVSSERFTEDGQPYTVFHPGFDYVPIEGIHYWVRTRPEYVIGIDGSAELILQDDDLPAAQIVSVMGSTEIAFEEPRVDGHFDIQRSGGTEGPLTVRLRWSGFAVNGVDFAILPTVIDLAPGETFRRLIVQPLADGVVEPEETIVLGIEPDPAYGIEGGTAQVRLRDRAEWPQDLAIARRLDGGLEITVRGAPGSRLILEGSDDLSSWNPVRTNLLFNTDSATVALPAPASTRFFRTSGKK